VRSLRSLRGERDESVGGSCFLSSFPSLASILADLLLCLERALEPLGPSPSPDRLAAALSTLAPDFDHHTRLLSIVVDKLAHTHHIQSFLLLLLTRLV
jgi:hypothetical protein